jgi:tetratricopeptide (TPR) repeat protein
MGRDFVYIFSSSMKIGSFMPPAPCGAASASFRRDRFRRALLLFLSGILVIAWVGCRSGNKLPDKSSSAYAGIVSTFYVGLAALQVGDDIRADSKLAQLTQLVPKEPAGWANWGVLALRQRNFEAAAQRLERARALAPQNDRIHDLLGVLESSRGHSAEAIADWQKAMETNPRNFRAAYHLAEEIERQGGPSADAEFQDLIQKILTAQQDNLAALLELSRVAAKRGDAVTLRQAVTQISARSAAWPPEVQQQLAAVEAAAAGPDPHAAATRTTFLRNVLMRVPEFRESLAVLKAQPGEEAEPLTHFLRLQSPVFAPAPPDMALAFTPQPLSNPNGGRWNWIGAISLTGTGAPVVVVANGREVRLSTGASFVFPGGSAGTPPEPDGLLAMDFNYDFKSDLVLAGAGGVRLMRQDNPNAFTDVTPRAKLPASVTNANYTGAWAVDIESDGDLDIVLGARTGTPLVLRNNGDGTFTPIHPFTGVSGVRGFAWADFDDDGNPDAAIIDGSGRLRVFHNERAGQFRERTLPSDLPLIKAISPADADGDGIFDLLAVEENGAIVRLSDKGEGRPWEKAEIAKIPNAAAVLTGGVRLRIADLDNNGALDLILAPTRLSAAGSTAGALVWLGNDKGGFAFLGQTGPALVFDAADVNGNGRLDLLGFSADGQAIQAINRGSKNYHWQIIRPRAKQATGDQRINSFGVGGEMEIRSGLLVQKQPITGPQIHFGLGDQSGADVLRIVWPNGSVRAEFELQADQEVLTEQRIKGSCPYLFAFNGKQVEFVKDAVPWSSAIGLRINTLGTARVEATEEWYKIGPKELVPHDGFYDLRITAELWETYYYDYLALMVVDHPEGTDVFVDERFVVPPAKLAITSTAAPHKIVRAMDDRGQDVTDIVSTLDDRYLDTFGRGQYQGVTRDHYVEVDLGDEAPKTGPLWLIVKGWMHPTDSSINVAIGQGHHETARGLSLEVPDGRGGWVVAKSGLGFPAGRKKICLIDLTNVFRPATPHRVRLRTNLEIYWDSIEWAKGLPDAPLETVRLDPAVADLHYRGYSVMNQANPSSPELPDYNRLEGTKQRWRDLAGYYTRFGDVRELLARVDDRYVIMNSGDEMSFRFTEQPPPRAGWVRDYLIVGDGWIKDGDYNSGFSRTVQPLPYHAKSLYVTAPERLEDEWVYRHHPEDWQNYHTRYVTPDVFQNALRGDPRQ